MIKFIIEIIECVDNGEFITTAVFKIDNDVIIEFLEKYSFEKVESDFKPNFTGIYFLNKENLKFPDANSLYLLEDCDENNSWYFLMDIESGYIWCEILYPDLGGTKPSLNF